MGEMLLKWAERCGDLCLKPLKTIHRLAQTERCQKSRTLMLKGVGPAVMILLAAIVGWWLYPRTLAETSWALIDEVHASWDPQKRVLNLSLRFTKRIACANVIVSKHLTRVENGTVIATDPVPLEGTLSEQMSKKPVGVYDLFDAARLKPPFKTLGREDYQLSLVATCEDWNDKPIAEPELSTPVVRKLITVSYPPHTGLATLRPRFS